MKRPKRSYSDSSASRPDEKAAAALIAPAAAVASPTCVRHVDVGTHQEPGPSLATGMSSDPANAGGRHVNAPTFSASDFVSTAPATLEKTSLTVAGALNFDAEVAAIEAQWERDCILNILQSDGAIGWRYNS